MLEHTWHWHFAKKLSPAMQEKRLLCFADDDDGNPLEQPQEGSSEKLDQSSTDDILEISGKTSKNVTELAPEIAKTVAWSPFVLEQTLEILRDEQLRKRFPTVDFDKMNRSIGLRIQELEKGKGDSELAEGITKDIEHFINDEELAVKLSQAFERRIKHFHELEQQLGSTPVSEIITLEKKVGLENKSLTAYLDEDAWKDSEVDAIVKTLDINPEIALDNGKNNLSPEEQRALDALVREIEITDTDRDSSGNPTKSFKLKLIQKKVMAARKIAAIEKNDLASETSMGSMEEMERKFFEQIQLARKHALALLKRHAEKLSTTFKDRIRPIVEQYGDQPERIAKDLGISETALHRRFAEVHTHLERAKGTSLINESEEDPENLRKTSDQKFTQKSVRLSGELRALAWIEADDATFEEELLGSDRSHDATDVQERNVVIAWVTSYAPSLQSAANTLSTDTHLQENLPSSLKDLGNLTGLAKFATNLKDNDGEPSPEDEEFLFDEFTVRRRRQLELIVAAVESPHIINLISKDEKEIQKDTSENTTEVSEKLQGQLAAIEQICFGNGIDAAPTHSALQHESIKALGADGMIRNKLKVLRSNLTGIEKIHGEKGLQIIRESALEIRKFQEVLKQLDALSGTRIVELSDMTAYQKACGTTDSPGCYNPGDGLIYLNLNIINSESTKQHTLYHEQGHAIVDTLMRSTGLLPQLFVGMSMYLKQEVPGMTDGTTFEDMLFDRAEDWMMADLYDKFLEKERALAQKQNFTGDKLERIAKQRADGRYKEMLIDELINKFASYKNGKNLSNFKPEDKALFDAIDTGSVPEKISVSDEFAAANNDGIALQDSSGMGDDDEEEGGGGGIEIAASTTEDISASRNSLLIIKSFIDSHDNVDGIDIMQERYDIEKDYLENEIEKPFYGKTLSEEELAPRLLALGEDIKEVTEEIDRLKSLELDMSKQGPSGIGGGGLMGFLKGIEFVSIMDIVNTVKQGAEDVQRMWKRRGERAQSRLGKNLTEWIGDWVPYAGQLKHEYDKRGNASEIEEVNQWKEALKDQDSYALLSMLGNTRNKDQVRAIAEVLSERGRMDWNYVPFWNTLNALSSYHMPEGPCAGSDILRDKWLQKLITDIWGDKDKYFDWRQQNDGAVDSGKKKFTTTTDQLSNVSGGLAANLERQLQLWIEKSGSNNIPEDINPHLYEEILEYSMRNGKMTMEEKLYYLVQGVAKGLLSIDRLRAMAGQDGGILNIFPFIDYFYGKNNSMTEIKALANRITESGASRYKPGPKTTLWLHLELTRNESAKARMAKATSGSRTEELDHEDIPTIISQMDYKGVEELTGVLSGSRFKMSYEAAKNTYTGFGTKFKILAQLAQLHKDGDATFTEQDAQEAAKSIAAYAHLDNILTRNGMDKATRIEVTLDQIAGQTAPSADGHKVKEYREGNNQLIRSVIDGIPLDWSKIDANQDEYVRNQSEEDGQLIVANGSKRQSDNFNATKQFSRELSKSLADPSNRATLIDILANMAGDFKEESYYNKIETGTVKQYLGERSQHGNDSSVGM